MVGRHVIDILKAERQVSENWKQRTGISMYRQVAFFAYIGVLCMSFWSSQAQLARLVDPYIGSEGGGNVFIGPSLPFGMLKAGPDVGDNSANSGWSAAGSINGFSQTHVTGTGGGAKYGNILVQPTVGDPSPDNAGSMREGERAVAGLYSVRLIRYGIDVAITTTRRAAIYRFTYPHSNKANLIFDLGHCLSSYANQHEDQRVIASEVDVISNHEFSGSTTVEGGWNQQKRPYRIFFYAAVDTPGVRIATWQDGESPTTARLGSHREGIKTGAWMQFRTIQGQKIHLKIGISFHSTAQARQNAMEEIRGFRFKETQARAERIWSHALGRVEVKGLSLEARRMFYTALYHAMLMPTDRSGENSDWQSTEPYYDDFYAIWDTFRSSGPLLTLIAPERQIGIVRALVDIYRHEGWLPDARSGNVNGRTQGGSNAEFLIADAYVKHLPRIDWKTAYAAIKNDAEVSPQDQFKEGRGGLDDWKTKGYVTIEGVDRPGSKQMEYAADDFEIALLAHALGKTRDFETYLRRSGNWRNLWNADYEEDGVKGFIWPRHQDGSWKTPFNSMEKCTWLGDSFYEGNSWTYSTFVPHDMAKLVQISGGQEAFARRLDRFFAVPGRYNVGNEPGFLAPYLYLWTNHPQRTADHLREILALNFNASRSGISGNDDSGAMSSWYAFGAMGIFPNAGQDVYLIGSPMIPETVLHVAHNRRFTIAALEVSVENKYVVAVELNGKPYSKAWIRHEDIVKGGSLVLHMAAKPGAWPSGDVPPSASTTFLSASKR